MVIYVPTNQSQKVVNQILFKEQQVMRKKTCMFTTVTILSIAILLLTGCSMGNDPGDTQPDPSPVRNEFDKIVSVDAIAHERFGSEIAVSGNLMVVSTPDYDNDSGAEIVYGQGRVYVFTYDETDGWTQRTTLTASNGVAYDNFGDAVAVSGNTIVVGVQDHDTDDVYSQGIAYVYTPTTVWDTDDPAYTETQLIASDGAALDNFGRSVAVSGDTIIVGAPRADIASEDRGTAYLFTSTDWSSEVSPMHETVKLTASDGAGSDSFGSSVAITEDTILIGADCDDSRLGSAYVFTSTDWSAETGTVSETVKLIPAARKSFGYFGKSIALSSDGTNAVIGCPGDGSYFPGTAYLFSSDDWAAESGTLTEDAALSASDGQETTFFGEHVAISADGSTVVASSSYTELGENEGQGCGYLYTYAGGGWTEQYRLVASDGEEYDALGWSIAITGDTVLLGAYTDDIGENTAQGSVYAFSTVVP